MTVVRDPARRVYTNVTTCKRCGASVYWSFTGAGKRAQFDVDRHGATTRVLHATTCVPKAAR